MFSRLLVRCSVNSFLLKSYITILSIYSILNLFERMGMMRIAIFISALVCLSQASSQAAPTPSDDKTLICKANTCLGLAIQNSNEIGSNCAVPSTVCGKPLTCQSYSHVGSVGCVNPLQYSSGISIDNDIVRHICCTYGPRPQDYTGDECETLTILNDEAPTSPSGRYSADANTRTQGGRLATSKILKVIANLTELPPGNPAKLLKLLKKLPNGFTVTYCNPVCGRSTTTKKPTTTKPSTHKPESPEKHQQQQQQQQQAEVAKHPKRPLISKLTHGQLTCFSADMTVMTPRGIKRMDQVRAGDEVMVVSSNSKPMFEKIEWFYHRNPNVDAEFVTLTTQSQRVLELSDKHLIPVVPCSNEQMHNLGLDYLANTQSIFAHRVRVGRCVATFNGTEFVAEKVVKITRERKRGIYSPITNYGTIVVNDLYVSCFSGVENHLAQQTVHSTLIYLRRMVSGVWNTLFGSKLEQEDANIPVPLQMLLKMAQFVLPSISTN